MNSPREIRLDVTRLLNGIVRIPAEAPVNLERIAQSLGASIVYENMLSDGSVEKVGSQKYRIKVNANQIPRRQRFTIAHELSHIILSFAKTSSSIASTKEYLRSSFSHSDEEEKACNEMAAEILIPRSAVERFFDWNNISIEEIRSEASRWNVSLTAMLWYVVSHSYGDGGFVWFKRNLTPDFDYNSELRVNWGVFPNSPGKYVQKDSVVPEDSIINKIRKEEVFFPYVHLRFAGINDTRSIRLRSFGNNCESVLGLIYPIGFCSPPSHSS